MQAYAYTGTGAHLRQEIKRNWQMGTLDQVMYFMHGGPVLPVKAHREGLSPDYGQEFLTHAETELPIGGGKLLFAFRIAAGGQPPANFAKPGGVGRLWGYDAHSYVFRAGPGTTFYAQNGQVNQTNEVAFPYVIESADIAFYCAPSKGYVYKVDQAGRPEARDPRGKFQRVAWNAGLIAALTQVHGNAPAPG